jgi:Lrp/AsnC family leucine-responsive transcriptional regulator
MIDDIDREIILRLQEDARLSNAALAEVVGLSTSGVHERVKRLEARGVIKGYVALVEAEVIGKPIMAFIRLVAQDYTESKVSLREICETEADILECHGVAGDDCYLLKVRATSPKDLERLLERIRSNMPGSKSVTNIVLTTFKESSRVVPGA